MKRLTETARLYQLEKGHNLVGVLYHCGDTARFKYGFLGDTRAKTNYIHGIDGGQSLTTIETVERIVCAIGDKIEMADGTRGKVVDISTQLLDEVQLRFVQYDAADKVVRLSIRYL